MNLPYMPGVRRVSPAGLPCDPGRVESGVRKRFRFIALLTLAVFMAGGTAASAATIANHMDYPVEGFSLWCQDPQQHWIERKLTGHLDIICFCHKCHFRNSWSFPCGFFVIIR